MDQDSQKHKTPSVRIPDFLVNPHPKHPFREAVDRLPFGSLSTVCQEARCHNRGECLLKHGTVSVMVLGNVCTRACPFCAVTQGRPLPPDPKEAAQLLELSLALQVKYLAVTMPNRDDLADGGSSHLASLVKALREGNPNLVVEILASDFQGKESSYEALLACPPDVIAHDLQTVPRLYASIRPGARYERSLGFFRWFRDHADAQKVRLKGGLMVGFGETPEEVEAVLKDAAEYGVKYFTIGQYLKPPGGTLEPSEYVPLERYQAFIRAGERVGLKVQASPLTRSSYLADVLAKEKS
jgi:lipoic acid synthetase